MNSADQQDDGFDYVMSDTFISGARQHSYRSSFRVRRHPRRPSLAYINSLSDRAFDSFLRAGCRFSHRESSLQAELDDIRAELRELKAEMRALKQVAIRTTPPRLALTGGGLDVPSRA